MALFGLGYVLPKVVSKVVSVCGGSEETQKGAQAVTAMVSFGFDPLGAGASIAEMAIKGAAKEGHRGAQAAVVGIAATSLIAGGDPTDFLSGS